VCPGFSLGHGYGKGQPIPKNVSTDRTYSGINVLPLWASTIEQGFAGQSWLTFRQAMSLGGHVRKGERGTTVVYTDRFVPTRSGAPPRPVTKRKRFHSSSALPYSTQISESLPGGSPPPHRHRH
jgi:antirestriction protein ArdC